jgi:hypothetical protein
MGELAALVEVPCRLMVSLTVGVFLIVSGRMGDI